MDVVLKVEFIDLSYMLEEHVPLSDPDNYPIYVINEFPDLAGNFWNLKYWDPKFSMDDVSAT